MISLLSDLRAVLGLSKAAAVIGDGRDRFIDLSMGSRGSQSFANLNAGSESTVLQSGESRVYGLSFFVSAAGGGVFWDLVDATASGIGPAPKYRFQPVAVGYYNEEFVRPLSFTKGIVISYTATAGNFSRQIFFSAV